MTTTVQVNGDTIFLNGTTLTDVIASAVKQGVKEIMDAQKEDPLELITLADVCQKVKCSIRTVERRINDRNIKVSKVGRHRCIFRKDITKLFQS